MNPLCYSDIPPSPPPPHSISDPPPNVVRTSTLDIYEDSDQSVAICHIYIGVCST